MIRSRACLNRIMPAHQRRIPLRNIFGKRRVQARQNQSASKRLFLVQEAVSALTITHLPTLDLGAQHFLMICSLP